MSTYDKVHTIQGKKAIRLRGVGFVPVKPIEQFKKGDIVAYHHGGTGIFISKKEVSPKFWEITTNDEGAYGGIYQKRVKKGTLKPYYTPRKKVSKPKPPAAKKTAKRKAKR